MNNILGDCTRVELAAMDILSDWEAIQALVEEQCPMKKIRKKRPRRPQSTLS